MQDTVKVSETDLIHLRHAVELALEAEARGNFAVGSVITLQGELIAEAANSMLVPQYNPIWHAEMAALVYSAGAADVHTVIVGGEVIVRDHKILTMDEQAVIQRAQHRADELRQAD